MQDWMSVFLLWMQQRRQEWLRNTARTLYWMQHRLLVWEYGYLLPGGLPGGFDKLRQVLTIERFRPQYVRPGWVQAALDNGGDPIEGKYSGPGW